jgi:amidophosphoribosyltransferase
MGGIFGIVSKEDCAEDLFWGTFYLQHRAQEHCGIALCNDKQLINYTHKGLIKQQFPVEDIPLLKGNYGMGATSGDRQPVSEYSKVGGMIIGYDGNLINYEDIKGILLNERASFSGYHSPEAVQDVTLISKIISKEKSFDKGIERLVSLMKGDFAIISLSKDGIYAARGWGRKPLILGQKDGSYLVSSESNSFVNPGAKIVRDVKPGEIVLLNEDGIQSIRTLELDPIKYGTFEWVYNAYPVSVIDGISVAVARKNIGKALAERYPIEADIVSPIPNSGKYHATGYSRASRIPYEEVFVRYDYSDRSYTPAQQYARDLEARTKLIPIEGLIKGQRIIIVDDSIVRGTQMLNKVRELRRLGAKEVHLRIACPPLRSACKYGKTTKKSSECIANNFSVSEIQKKLEADSLGYATVEDLEKAIGKPRRELCLDCWAEGS